MRAGARFTVSPFDWSCWLFVLFCFVFVWGGLLFRFAFLYLQDLSTVDSWVYLRPQAIRYKDCHYRYDERSTGPKKKSWRWCFFRQNRKKGPVAGAVIEEASGSGARVATCFASILRVKILDQKDFEVYYLKERLQFNLIPPHLRFRLDPLRQCNLPAGLMNSRSRSWWHQKQNWNSNQNRVHLSSRGCLPPKTSVHDEASKLSHPIALFRPTACFSRFHRALRFHGYNGRSRKKTSLV